MMTGGREEGGSRWRPRRRISRLLLTLLGAGVGLLTLLGGARYYSYATSHVSTDDAFIDGSIVQLSTQVAGPVASVFVADNQEVHQGDLLVAIDPRDYEARLAQARAALASAQAAAKQVAIRRSEAEQAGAQAAQAEAAMRQAELNLSYTGIYGPVSGHVTEKAVAVGAYVEPGQALMAMVQRVPVKIVFDQPPDPLHPLGPGMSVVPTVTGSRSLGS